MSNNPSWTQEEAQAALQIIVKRATTDAEFRQLFLTNAAAAVKEATGRDLPEGFSLRVVENKGADLTVVLPDTPTSSELSDSELEAVAGGHKCGAGTCGVSAVCGITEPCLVSCGASKNEIANPPKN